MAVKIGLNVSSSSGDKSELSVQPLDGSLHGEEPPQDKASPDVKVHDRDAKEESTSETTTTVDKAQNGKSLERSTSGSCFVLAEGRG